MSLLHRKRLERALIDACRVQTAATTDADTAHAVLGASSAARRAALTGVLGEQVISVLETLALEPQAAAALTLVPPLSVSWRSQASRERRQHAAGDVALHLGLREGDPGHVLLATLAGNAADDDILAKWAALVNAIVPALEPDALQALQNELVDRAWLMASTLHGSVAAEWPTQTFAALRDVEQSFYEVSVESHPC